MEFRVAWSSIAGFSLVAGILLFVVYLVALGVYRLCFSPIAKFPGPRLAALTFWYEFWYDVLWEGRYSWRIREMHERFGPIVRINPHELHILDSSFYDEIYVGSIRRTEKWHWSAKMFGTTQAAVGTTSHEHHRLRRAALNPFFSKKRVEELESGIQENVDRLCQRLKEYSRKEDSVNLSDAFTCLSADVIGSYAFGRSYGFLGWEDFNPGWRKLMMELSRSTHLMKQFGWLYRVLTAIPERLVGLLHPLTKQLFALQNGISAQIQEIKSQEKSPASNSAEEKEDAHRLTIFHDLLQSNRLPPQELQTDRLAEEALTLIGAGTVTTAHTLATLSYHILSNASILARLRSELSFPAYSTSSPENAPESPSWTKLTTLPYLFACISEALRLSYGVSHRLQRINPDDDMRYRGWTIPRGTPVSMTQMFVHTDPDIFPDPDVFIPERWLFRDENDEEEKEEVNRRKRFLVPFSKGTRMCVGMNLAYAELYLTVAALFRPVERGGVEMELFETGREDVEVVHDFFNPSPRMGSLGVRVLVRKS
ncbi:putative P450 monooxygenase [Aulographum hederae CBS 113979]|uniref:Putative P450 monooxygenase n=1 Tax=Aulographum hederae CBS 113979 TaxID=1176131 RepID=A0A6G1H4H9_9PEZI|nr:putative P450 monooxygenase [Aulographum hederae CBS 113979]